MSKPRAIRILVVVPGASTATVGDTMVAAVTRERGAIDELHVLIPAAAAERVRAALLTSGSTFALTDVCRRLRIARSDIVFSRRTIHALGVSEHLPPAHSLADDTLEIVRKLCADDMNEITMVASSNAGALGILAHVSLQLVGRSRDRFLMLEHETRRRSARPSFMELPLVLAERPLPADQDYHELAESRRLARRRLSEPGTLTLNARHRVFRIDDLTLAVPRLQFFWMFSLATLAPRALPLRFLSGNFDIGGRGEIVVSPDHLERAELDATIAHLRRIFVTLFPDTAEEFAVVFKRACGTAPGLPSLIAKLNANLKRTLGIGAAPYLIAGGRGTAGYRLTLPPARIKLEPRIPAPEARRPHTR